MKTKLWLSIALLAGAISALAGVGVYRYFSDDFYTLDGAHYRWNQLAGDWVIVNYFAEWCAPCLREVPELNQFSQLVESKSHFHFFAASYDALSDDKLTRIQQKYDMQFDLISSQSENLGIIVRPKQLPATLIIDPNGKLRKTLLGEQTAEGLSEIINQLERL